MEPSPLLNRVPGNKKADVAKHPEVFATSAYSLTSRPA
jgi:hypothetical protein